MYDRKRKLFRSLYSLFLTLCVLHNISIANRYEHGSILNDSASPETLEVIKASIESNKQKIMTWQGQMEFADKSDVNFTPKLLDSFENLKNIPNKITKSTQGTISFAVNCEKDKLFTDFRASKPTWTDGHGSVLNRTDIEWRETSIITPEKYSGLIHNIEQGPDKNTLFATNKNLQTAYIDQPFKGRNKSRSTVVDPRKLCEYGTPVVELLNVLIDSWAETNAKLGGQYKNTLEIISNSDGRGEQYRLNLFAHPGGNKRDYATMEMIFDSEVGYNLVSVVTGQANGIKDDEKKWIYEKVDGSYVPKFVTKRVFRKDGQTVLFEREVKFTKHLLNETLSQETFTYRNLGLKNGDRVVNRIKAQEYLYANNELVSTLEQAMDIATDIAIEDLFEDNEKSLLGNSKRLFLPKMNMAINKDIPWVLDLKSASVINLKLTKELNSEESSDCVKGKKRGDLVWDGEIVSVRGTSVYTVLQEKHRPLKHTPYRWLHSYELPNNVELPYAFLAVTEVGEPFLIKMIKMSSQGVTLECRALKLEEVEKYRKIKKKPLSRSKEASK